ncbi:MAG TPA: glycosyltransferase [Actinomycetota bacterium]|nr:glycosyltransferase [Actinomycetota bacterium]
MPDPVPVLFVVNSLGHGGTERQLALTLGALDRAAFPPAVVTLFGGGPNLEPIRDLGIPVRVLGLPRRALGRAAAEVAAAGRAHGAAIIHTALVESHFAGRIAARRTGALAVSHMTNEFESPVRGAEPEPRTAWKAAAVKAAERWTRRWSRGRLIAVADAVADSGARFFGVPRSEIPVVRRGFRFDDLDRQAAAPPGDPPWSDWAEPRLLAVGRLSPQKGHRYLALALAQVVASFPKAQVAVAGEGPLAAELEAIARSAGVEEHLRLAGPRSDVPALLRAADAFVFPSLWEGAAGALVEAAALGAPIVASDIPPHREILDPDRAVLVAPRDAAALAEGVAGVLGDLGGARRRAAELAKEVRAAHDIEANTRLLEAAYRRFLTERSSARPRR